MQQGLFSSGHMLQGVAGCCREFQCDAVRCSVVQCGAVWCSSARHLYVWNATLYKWLFPLKLLHPPNPPNWETEIPRNPPVQPKLRVSFWICTEQFEFLDLVDFGEVEFSVETLVYTSVTHARSTPQRQTRILHTHPVCIVLHIYNSATNSGFRPQTRARILNTHLPSIVVQRELNTYTYYTSCSIHRAVCLH